MAYFTSSFKDDICFTVRLNEQTIHQMTGITTTLRKNPIQCMNWSIATFYVKWQSKSRNRYISCRIWQNGNLFQYTIFLRMTTSPYSYTTYSWKKKYLNRKQTMFHIFIARDKYLQVMFKKLLLDDHGKFSDILLPKTVCMNNLNIQCSKPIHSYVLSINLKNTKRKVKSNQKYPLIQ